MPSTAPLQHPDDPLHRQSSANFSELPKQSARCSKTHEIGLKLPQHARLAGGGVFTENRINFPFSHSPTRPLDEVSVSTPHSRNVPAHYDDPVASSGTQRYKTQRTTVDIH